MKVIGLITHLMIIGSIIIIALILADNPSLQNFSLVILSAALSGHILNNKLHTKLKGDHEALDMAKEAQSFAREANLVLKILINESNKDPHNPLARKLISEVNKVYNKHRSQHESNKELH